MYEPKRATSYSVENTYENPVFIGVLKATGTRALVTDAVEHIKKRYVVIRISPLQKNREDDGYHVYCDIGGLKDE